jgi:hypothetical protein
MVVALSKYADEVAPKCIRLTPSGVRLDRGKPRIKSHGRPDLI